MSTPSSVVYLPEGVWHDWWTHEAVEGGRWIERPVDLATIPLYARAGSIIPLDPVRQYTGEAVTEPTILRVFPGSDGTFTLYDDDGGTLGYRDGSDPATTWIRFRWDDAARTLFVERDARALQPPGGVRPFNIEAVDRPGSSQRIEFRGEPIAIKL